MFNEYMYDIQYIAVLGIYEIVHVLCRFITFCKQNLSKIIYLALSYDLNIYLFMRHNK
jgi:hypothetical protein